MRFNGSRSFGFGEIRFDAWSHLAEMRAVKTGAKGHAVQKTPVGRSSAIARAQRVE